MCFAYPCDTCTEGTWLRGTRACQSLQLSCLSLPDLESHGTERKALNKIRQGPCKEMQRNSQNIDKDISVEGGLAEWAANVD